MFQLQKLPFNHLKFEGILSAESFEFHYHKHHQTYVDNLNKLIAENTAFHNHNLEAVISKAFNHHTAIFNNAAQHWNHTFFWNSITVQKQKVSASVERLINKSFGSLENFEKLFIEKGVKLFGSGWCWLIFHKTTQMLEIVQTNNANIPEAAPLLVIDVWEHAYYIDYRNRRLEYLQTIINHLNWEFVEYNLQKVL